MVFNKNKKANPQSRNLVILSDSKSIYSEQFRTLRTNITFAIRENNHQTIIVTSSIPAEGKSTIVANLAIVFAHEGKKVLIVDADMRKPTLHYTFMVNNGLGLSTLLINDINYKEVIQETSIKGLSIISSGQIPFNPSELLSSKSIDRFLESAKQQFDIILFDAPPLLAVTDAQILTHKCEGTIFVINSGKVDKDDVIKANLLLKQSSANVLGVVLNNYKLKKDYSYYQYSEKENL